MAIFNRTYILAKVICSRNMKGFVNIHKKMCDATEADWQQQGKVLVINTLRLRQNGRHFPDDIFKWIFLNENVLISIKISLKFVPKSPINNIPALV